MLDRRQLVHDGQQNRGFVEIIFLGVPHGRELLELAVRINVIYPWRHDHTAAVRQGFEEFHIVDGFIVSRGHGAKLLPAQAVRMM